MFIPLFSSSSLFFFFNDTATTEIYTLSLHDALPISSALSDEPDAVDHLLWWGIGVRHQRRRSEEHTSELQSQSNLVCRLLLEKKNTAIQQNLRLLEPGHEHSV